MNAASPRATATANEGLDGGERVRIVGVALCISLAACSTPLCDHDAAEAALAAASAGETVELGACEVQGPLHVPPGVTLAGTGGTVVVAPAGSGAIVLLGGEPASTVRGLAVRVEGRIGILARGGGRAAIEDVDVDASRGVAIGATELSELSIARTTLRGPIDETTALDPIYLRVVAGPPVAGACTDPSCECTPGDVRGDEACDASGRWATMTATHGVYASGVGSVVLTDVEVIGFAEHGVVLSESDAVWNGGRIDATLGTGLRQVGGTLSASDVTVEHTYAGLRGEAPYAIAVTDEARFDGARLTVSDNDRYGLVLVGSAGTSASMIAERNGDAAVWLGGTDEFALTDGSFADNRFATLVITESSNVAIERTRVDRTRAMELAGLRPGGVVRLGDGVHVHASTAGIRLADMTLGDNERAGIVLDLGASGTPDVAFSTVVVDGTGSQLGAIAGRLSGDWTLATETPAGWDTGITRGGVVGTNDAAFTGTLDAIDLLAPGIAIPENVVGVVAPMF